MGHAIKVIKQESKLIELYKFLVTEGYGENITVWESLTGESIGYRVAGVPISSKEGIFYVGVGNDEKKLRFKASNPKTFDRILGVIEALE